MEPAACGTRAQPDNDDPLLDRPFSNAFRLVMHSSSTVSGTVSGGLQTDAIASPGFSPSFAPTYAKGVPRGVAGWNIRWVTVHWEYLVPIMTVHALALFALLPWCFSWSGLVIALVGTHVFGMGINLGYHRLLTHRRQKQLT